MRLGTRSSRIPKELGDVAVEFWLQNMHDRWREPSAAEVPCAPAPQHGEALCDDFFRRQAELARAAHGARCAVGDVVGKVPWGAFAQYAQRVSGGKDPMTMALALAQALCARATPFGPRKSKGNNVHAENLRKPVSSIFIALWSRSSGKVTVQM